MNELLFIIFRAMIFLSVALLVIGIFKPEWLRFREKQPGRTTIIAAAIGLLLIGFIGAGAIQYAGKNDAEAVNRGKMLGEAVYVVNENPIRCDPGMKPGGSGAVQEHSGYSLHG